MANKSIVLVEEPVMRIERLAVAAITPGHLVELTSANKVQKHSTAGANALPKMFAVENDLEGQDIDDAYAADDIVQVNCVRPGDQIYAYLATSQTIAIGDALESASGGLLRKHTATSSTGADYPNCIVGIALEAVTTTGTAARIKIMIV